MFDSLKPTITPEAALAAMPAQVIDGLSCQQWNKLEVYGRAHNMLLQQFRALKANHVGFLVYQQHSCKIKAALAVVEAAKHLEMSSMDATLTRLQGSHRAAVEALIYPGVLPKFALY